MTIYRLPDWLGGHKCRALNEGDKEVLVEIDQYESARIIVPRDLLTEVKPPLPPVPDVLAVAIGDHVFCRDDDLDGPFFACPGAPVCHKRTYDWAELNELAREEGKPIIPLVPDLADDAPELPWDCDDAMEDGDLLIIEPARRTDLAAFIKTSRDGVRLTATHARQAAAVLLRAAREVEQS